MAETNQPADSIVALVGHDDGVQVTNPTDDIVETVVYDYDDDGQFLGWHKEKAK